MNLILTPFARKNRVAVLARDLTTNKLLHVWKDKLVAGSESAARFEIIPQSSKAAMEYYKNNPRPAYVELVGDYNAEEAKQEAIAGAKEQELAEKEAVQDVLPESALRALAKEKGIKSWHVKSLDRLKEELKQTSN